MKRIILTLGCALALAACAGNGGSNAAAQQPVETEELTEPEEIVKTFRKVPLPQDCEGVAFQAYQQMMAERIEEYEDSDIQIDLSKEAPEGSTISYSEDTDDIEGYYEERTMDCLPLLDGGWLAIYTWMGAAEGEPTGYDTEVFTFINGELTPAEGFLPVPKDLDGLLKPDACEGQDEQVAKLKTAYAERPQDWLAYECDAQEQTLTVQFRPCDPYLEQYENHIWTDDCWDLIVGYADRPVYKWDGKRFVK